MKKKTFIEILLSICWKQTMYQKIPKMIKFLENQILNLDFDTKITIPVKLRNFKQNAATLLINRVFRKT